MADVASIGSATTVQSAGSSTASGLSSLDAQDFFGILIAQLQQQDPMQPMSNEAMVSQMAAIRDMEMNYTLTEALKRMTNEQRFAGAAGLIGKYVEGTVENADGEEITLKGVVTAVRFSEKGKAILELDNGDTLPLEKLTQVQANVPGTENDAVAESLQLAAKTGAQSRRIQAANSLASFGLTNKDGLNIGFTLS